MNGRHDPLVAAVAVVAATVVLFGPWFVGALLGEPRWFEWDVPEQYWPDLVFLCDALHDGTLPYWNPYDRAGYPYYADPQAGLYHPMNWAICALSERPPIAAAELRTILAFPLTGVFGLLWLRGRRLCWSGSVLGAVVLMAAPFMRHNWELNLTTAFAWAPLMLWAVDRAVARGRAWDGATLGVAFALCAWVGSPPALWQASSLTALYGALRAVGELRRRGRRHLRGLLRALGAAALVGVGFVGVVFVPGLELAHHSVQAGRSYESIAAGSLAPEDLWALVVPRPGNHLYVGWIALATALVALRRASRLPLALLGVVAVLLALGDGGPLFRAAYELVPGVALFRAPHRYEAWLGPVAALLAASGVDGLARAPWGRPDRRWALAAAFAGGALLAALPEVPGAGALLLGLAVALAARSLGALRRAWVGALAALCLLAEVTAALPAARHTRGGPHPCRLQAPAALRPYLGPGRYVDEFVLGCRSGTRLSRRELRGYQDPLTLASFERVLASLADTPELALQFDVHYALQGPHFIHGWNRHFLPPPDRLRERRWARAVHDRGPARVTELRGGLPLVYWVPDEATVRVRGRQEALAWLRRRAPAAVAILEGAAEEVPPAPLREAALRPATDLHLERDRLSFRIDAPAPGWVVVNEAWYPGWVATVDGRRGPPVERANGLVRAFPIEAAGPHEVVLHFAPPDGRLWRRVWVLTWIALLGWLFVRVRRRRQALRRAPGGGRASPGAGC